MKKRTTTKKGTKKSDKGDTTPNKDKDTPKKEDSPQKSHKSKKESQETSPKQATADDYPPEYWKRLSVKGWIWSALRKKKWIELLKVWKGILPEGLTEREIFEQFRIAKANDVLLTQIGVMKIISNLSAQTTSGSPKADVNRGYPATPGGVNEERTPPAKPSINDATTTKPAAQTANPVSVQPPPSEKALAQKTNGAVTITHLREIPVNERVEVQNYEAEQLRKLIPDIESFLKDTYTKIVLDAQLNKKPGSVEPLSPSHMLRPLKPEDRKLIADTLPKTRPSDQEAFTVKFRGRYSNGIEFALTYDDLDGMRDKQWYLDSSINIYSEKLRLRTKKLGMQVFVYQTSFYQSLMSGGGKLTYAESARGKVGDYNFKNVQNWTAKEKLKLFDQKKIIWFINLNGQHWMVVVYDRSRCEITLYDSLYQTDVGGVIPNLLRYLEDEAAAHQYPFNKDAVKVVLPSDINLALQPNSHDCGPGACQAAHRAALGLPINWASGDFAKLRDITNIEILTELTDYKAPFNIHEYVDIHPSIMRKLKAHEAKYAVAFCLIEPIYEDNESNELEKAMISFILEALGFDENFVCSKCTWAEYDKFVEGKGKDFQTRGVRLTFVCQLFASHGERDGDRLKIWVFDEHDDHAMLDIHHFTLTLTGFVEICGAPLCAFFIWVLLCNGAAAAKGLSLPNDHPVVLMYSSAHNLMSSTHAYGLRAVEGGGVQPVFGDLSIQTIFAALTQVNWPEEHVLSGGSQPASAVVASLTECVNTVGTFGFKAQTAYHDSHSNGKTTFNILLKKFSERQELAFDGHESRFVSWNKKAGNSKRVATEQRVLIKFNRGDFTIVNNLKDVPIFETARNLSYIPAPSRARVDLSVYMCHGGCGESASLYCHFCSRASFFCEACYKKHEHGKGWSQKVGAQLATIAAADMGGKLNFDEEERSDGSAQRRLFSMILACQGAMPPITINDSKKRSGSVILTLPIAFSAFSTSHKLELRQCATCKDPKVILLCMPPAEKARHSDNDWKRVIKFYNLTKVGQEVEPRYGESVLCKQCQRKETEERLLQNNEARKKKKKNDEDEDE